MRCTDSILATTPDQLEAALATIEPAFRDSFRQGTAFQVSQCQTWGAHVPTAAEMALPVSDVPVLIMNGEFDPYSSPEAVATTLETLPNGHAYWIPGYGHGFNSNSCAQDIYGAFIDDPAAEPDSACIATIPPLQFNIPH
jgi:pimeloyl-ACP methyl ester carboxylesterase